VPGGWGSSLGVFGQQGFPVATHDWLEGGSGGWGTPKVTPTLPLEIDYFQRSC